MNGGRCFSQPAEEDNIMADSVEAHTSDAGEFEDIACPQNFDRCIGKSRCPFNHSDECTKFDFMDTNEVLAWSSERFAELFHDLPVNCFCFDNYGIVYEWNRACEQETGFDANQVLQRPFWETFCRPEDVETARLMTREVSSGKTYSDIEMVLMRADATTYHVINRTFPLRTHDGTIVGGISANVNIEQRKRAERALLDSEERLKLAMDVAQLRSWEWDLADDIVRWTALDAVRMGLPPECLNLPSEAFFARVHPEDRPLLMAAIEKSMQTRMPFGLEYRTITPDGRQHWSISRGVYIQDTGGKPVKLVGTALDITAAKEAEQQLRQAQELLEQRVKARTAELSTVNSALQSEIEVRKRAEYGLKLHSDIVRHMVTGILVYHMEDENDDYSFRLMLVNDAAHDQGIAAYKKEIGLSVREVFPPDVLPIIVPKLAYVARTGRTIDDENVSVAEDGTLKHAISVRMFPLPNRCVGVTLENVTRRRRAERELQRAHAQNAHILSSIGSILICIDERDILTSWNTMAEQVFGAETSATIGRKFTEAPIPWDWDPIVMALFECKNTKQAVRLDDVRYTTPQGKEAFLGLTINLLRDEQDNPSGYLILGTDITQRRVLESQLAQSQKLESIGSLAAGIAHEINTPIQYVGDNTRFLSDAFQDLTKIVTVCKQIVENSTDDSDGAEIVQQLRDVIEEADIDYLMQEIPAAVDQSLEGVGRVAHIVRAMKEFSHPGQEEMTTIDLNHAIDSTITVARNEWKYVADVVTDFDENLPPVPCYPSAFNQVILNMIINASHAIADVVTGSNSKGTITVTTRKQGRRAEIRISDTGTGIPPEIVGRIYDPFFTTKPVGTGTGQGLAISHTVIVEKHGGTINVDTKVGEGTTFTIRLPLDKKEG